MQWITLPSEILLSVHVHKASLAIMLLVQANLLLLMYVKDRVKSDITCSQWSGYISHI